MGDQPVVHARLGRICPRGPRARQTAAASNGTTTRGTGWNEIRRSISAPMKKHAAPSAVVQLAAARSRTEPLTARRRRPPPKYEEHAAGKVDGGHSPGAVAMDRAQRMRTAGHPVGQQPGRQEGGRAEHVRSPRRRLS